MYCENCGKEISDQAKFCKHCGASVTTSQPATPVQPQPIQPQPAPQAPTPKKKSGKAVIVIVIILIILAAIGYFSEAYLSGELDDTFIGDIFDKKSDVSLTESCTYGAVYQNGYITYGLARVFVHDCILQPGSGTTPDRLLKSNGTTIITVNNPTELTGTLSYDAITEQDIKDAYNHSAITNVEIVEFEKYTEEGYPVLMYVIGCTINGVDQYVGELVIFPEKEASDTLRISIQTAQSNSTSPITAVYDTLVISPDFALTMDDTNSADCTSIIAK